MAVRGVGKLVQVVGRRERELHKTVQERQLGLGVRRGLGRQDNRSCRAVRRVRRVQLGRLGQGRQGSQVIRVYLVGQLGRRVRLGRLGLGRQGSQVRPVYLVGQLGLGRRGSLESQLGQGDRPCLVCLGDLERLYNTMPIN